MIISKGKKAELAAEQLGIELICKNVGEIFEEKVISDFCRQYLKGNTPNPCIVCNPEVKFRTLAEEADKIGAEYIATGHYAGICRDEESGKWYISRSKNEKKRSVLHALQTWTGHNIQASAAA